MNRTTQYLDGRRNGIKWAITWLHDHAKTMNDPHAKMVLDTAAFGLGVDAKRHVIDAPIALSGSQGESKS